MTNKKKIFQLSLIFIGLIIIFFTYFFNLEKKQPSEVVIETETKENEEFLEEGVNRFENVEYKGIDNTGNKFTIGSQFAEFKKEKPELIFMENVECFFTFKDNTVLLISSKKGIYNKVEPIHFVTNIMSLIVFPFMCSPILKKMEKLNTKEFNTLMLERKKSIPKWIIKMIKK